MKIKTSFVVAILVSIFSVNAMASDSNERAYLIQMINQLNSLKPLIISANKEQPPNLRVKFHYLSYQDANGKPHNGLLEDINEIEKGIRENLNQASSQPRHFQAIRGDYLDTKNIKSSDVGMVMENRDVK
jgi:RAQPRD family integrative conjugative element protein